jgi:dGTP triphosphohydrolase
MMMTDLNQIQAFRLLTLLKGLELECKGMRMSGRSCYAIIKKEFNLKGNRANVLAQFTEMTKDLKK